MGAQPGKVYPKAPCTICGKPISNAGFARHAHEQMHQRDPVTVFEEESTIAHKVVRRDTTLLVEVRVYGCVTVNGQPYEWDAVVSIPLAPATS